MLRTGLQIWVGIHGGRVGFEATLVEPSSKLGRAGSVKTEHRASKSVMRAIRAMDLSFRKTVSHRRASPKVMHPNDKVKSVGCSEHRTKNFAL
jgi:hypothetical protein